MPLSTKSVVISGYYGFDNLGDEAILEQLCHELREIDPGIKICVLSQNPESTSKKYDVESISRWSVTAIYNALSACDLFISGGGGLFQDSSSIKSVVYYAFLFFLARLKRVPIFVYAQGIGPLRSSISHFLTKASMSLAACICVRDKKSQLILKRWNLDSYLTADPVWALSTNVDSKDNCDTNRGAVADPDKKLKIGLSLRQCDVLDESWLETISSQLKKSLPPKCILVPLVLQESLDKPVLDILIKSLDNFEIEQINLKPDDLPSLWLSSISKLDMMVAMRLHAAIMALKSGVATLALAYDPKVATVAKDFAQPYIEMKNPDSKKIFESKLLELLENTKELEQKAKKTASDKEKDARQNKELLAKFLR